MTSPPPAGTSTLGDGSAGASGARAGNEVVVLRGDTLWAIAARALPAGASDQAVAAASTRWFEANRDVIGTDPDLILPGQVLRAPT
ncbi:hypothetical protein Slu03_17240 [Sediminihabitans luteus]|uniref:LysM peptidoglycan-binding domain-containing protein n=1 Tax=Sediminihabitans luteus TaxID=1138585 RepID=UPI001A52F943|nr:LysM peptidoglycan-binding domain-containing protein [Sediminihabitans luteus]GII99346.1 hypothetical protein Slu03_17240 [Sediminihabitans luteus]